MTCFQSCPPCAGCEELRRKAAAAEATLDLVRGIVAEMREDATQPKGGQSVGPRRMPVALSIILELERAMGPGRGEYAAQAYFDLTARVEELEKALTGLRLHRWRNDGSEDCWCATSGMPEGEVSNLIHEDACNAARAALAATKGRETNV